MTVFVAMSGGVDSSVSALILKLMGYDVVGITMRIYDVEKEERSCCTAYDIEDAEAVARKIKIPHYTIDMREEFRKYVIEYFKSEYLKGRTPLPCANCNEYLKFRILLKKMEELGGDKIATGHYARIENIGGRYFIAKAKDNKKDQSYFLFTLESERIKKILFPVGELTKEEVRNIAEKYSLPVAKKKESQDICFTSDWREFIKKEGIKEKEGYFIKDGKIVGKHPGYFFFSIGQRKIGLALGEKVYVKKIIPEKNLVILGKKEEIKRKKFLVEIKNLNIEENEFYATVKVRYSHPGSKARVKIKGEMAEVELFEEYGPIVPGQAAVFYKDDIVLGGGYISDIEPEEEIRKEEEGEIKKEEEEIKKEEIKNGEIKIYERISFIITNDIKIKEKDIERTATKCA